MGGPGGVTSLGAGPKWAKKRVSRIAISHYRRPICSDVAYSRNSAGVTFLTRQRLPPSCAIARGPKMERWRPNLPHPFVAVPTSDLRADRVRCDEQSGELRC
jgi:hypothetical protein